MSTLKETFEKLLQGVEVVDYSNTDDFKAIWQKAICDKPLLILWSKTAPDDTVDPINTKPAVSPIALSIYLASKAGDDISQWPRIAILDCAPTAHEPAMLYQSVQSLRPERIPWLTLLTPKNLVSDDTQQNSSVLRGILCPDFDSKTLPAPQRKQIEETLKQLKRLIRLNITEGGSKAEFDRHALSNLISPMVLRGGKIPTKLTDSVHLPALRKLLEALELLPKDAALGSETEETISPVSAASLEEASAEASDPAGISPGTPLEPPLDLKDFQLVLLDDQGEQGWKEWLEETLSTSVELQKSPAGMLQRLKKALEPAGTDRKAWPKDLRFAFNPAATPEQTKQPILLLDLRLFSGDTTSEVAFFRELKKLIEDHFLDRTDLAWPSFTKTDSYEAAATALNQAAIVTDSLVHHELLTWFPRVLALADMSLPIILFSSTGRGYFVKRLQDASSIFTSFTKPNLLETALQSPTKLLTLTRSELINALAKAVKYLAPRKHHQQLLCEITPVNAGQQTNQNIPAPTRWKASIYLDETGTSPNLTFGALVALYQDGYSDSDLDGYLTKTFGHNVRGKTGKQWLRNQANISQILQCIEDLPDKSRPTLTFVRVSSNAANSFRCDLDTSDELHDERVGDNLWRQLFRQTVEVALYVVGRSLLPLNGHLDRFSVHGPTRSIPVTPHNRNLVEPLLRRWGIPTKSSGPDAGLFDGISSIEDAIRYAHPQVKTAWCVNSGFIDLKGLLSTLKPPLPPYELKYVRPDTIRPMVEEIMKLYRNGKFRPPADIVRAFGMNTHGSSKAREVDIMHFLADALLALDERSIMRYMCLETSQYGSSLEALLEFNRYVLDGQRPLALIALASEMPSRLPASVEKRIWNRVAIEVLAMTGHEYSDLTKLWLTNSVGSSHRTPRQNGMVEQWHPYWHDSKRIIRSDDGYGYLALNCRLDIGLTVTFQPARSNVPGDYFHATEIHLT